MVKEAPLFTAEVSAAIEKYALANAASHNGKGDTGAVMSKVLGEFPALRSNPSMVAQEVRRVLADVNSISSEEQISLLQTKYPGALAPRTKEEPHKLPPLPNAVKGRTAFRLPPEPSGFMTIGHAMAWMVNRLYADMYEGELWLRFEDTNPRKVAKRYYESFRRGTAWLKIDFDHEKCISADMDVMYDYGRKTVEEGLAYACSCGMEKVKKLRFEGIECEHRGVSESWSLRLWDELVNKKHKEGDFVIRFKGDMKSLNYSLRDPNIFRVIDHAHPLTGDRFTFWPTYYFANTVEDHICGITHVLRSSEFQPELQQYLREKLRLRNLEVIQFSRYNFKGTPVSKRLLRPLVEGKQVSGWDDPRMPTVDGVRRRGILPESIRQFTQLVGYSKAEHEYDWSMLFSINRKLLDPVSRRMFYVPAPVDLKVEGAPEREVTIPFHPENDLGARRVVTGRRFFIPGEDVKSIGTGTVFRLMDLYNVRLVSGGDHPVASFAGDSLIPETKKLQWVTQSNVQVKVSAPQALFSEEGLFNQESLPEYPGLAEESVSTLKVGEIVQFPRFGFCRLDAPASFILAHR
jgi:glutamyl-tRNA synthetase